MKPARLMLGVCALFFILMAGATVFSVGRDYARLPKTELVLARPEGEALRRAAELRKPVVILKAGRSAIGAIAAASHTGSMAGSSKAFESIFEKYGVIVARTLEEFMCLAQTMSVLNGNFPRKKEFAVISFSGGESTLSADVAEETGVALAELSEETKAEIKKYIPGFAAAKNPLDATAVHPESYAAAKSLLEECGWSLADVGTPALRELPAQAEGKGIPALAQRLGVGEPTIRDIISELLKPGRDPREELPPPLLRTDVMELKDLAPEMVLTGTVRNVLDFGAFVDIGVHEDGLVHISQLADKFVKHPSQVVKVGDVVKVKVLEVDAKRKRISLTMKGLN